MARLFVGGFIYDKRQAGSVFNGVSDNPGNIVRIGHCKIDELRGYGFFVPAQGGGLAGQGILSNKFDTRLGAGSVFTGRFEIEEDGEVALVAFTTLYPTSYGRSNWVVNDRSNMRTAMEVRYAISAGGNSFAGTDGGTVTQARSYPVRKGNPLSYTISFARGAWNYAPIVDDVTIYLLVPPIYYGFKQNFER